MRGYIGTVPTIDPTDDEWCKSRKMARDVKRIIGQIPVTEEVASSLRKHYKERTRLKVTPCSLCTISKTCEKRRRHKLTGCKFAYPRASTRSTNNAQ